MGRVERRLFEAWLVVRRADDLPGEWVAHCLDFDIFAQGNSLTHAVEAAHEAIGLVLADDLGAKRDPNDRRAPQSFWDDLYDTIAQSQPIKGGKFSELVEDEIETLVSRIVVACNRVCDESKVSTPIMFEKAAASVPAHA
jgi:predicted RNase H-like HicB family nuclease